MTDKTLHNLVHEFSELGATAAQQLLAGKLEAAASAIQLRDEILKKIETLNPETLPFQNNPGETILLCALEQTRNDLKAIKRARKLSEKLFA